MSVLRPTRVFLSLQCFILLWIGLTRPLPAEDTPRASGQLPIKTGLDVMRTLPSAPSPVTSQDASLSPPRSTSEHYHWKGLLLQSLEFNIIENSFRIASDDQVRDYLANKPYWHDYVASLKQYNMRRWNDGDNFLTNYVGHAMQGAVSGDIEIQNDPTGRMLEISRSRAYWKSRWLAMLWATVYSTQSEIGPMSEAAIGNEGGWTYPVNCKKPCPQYRPGIDNYTNNTGWVDFIITPTLGTLWIIAEDTLDRYVSDRVQGDNYTRRWPKYLRGGLSPARSGANLLRGQKPWFRDWQHSDTPFFSGIHFIPSDEKLAEQANRPRFEVSPHFTLLSIAVNTPACQNCRKTTDGTGIETSYRLARWLDADIDLNWQPNASPLPSDRAGGNLFNGLFGFRTGLDTENYALKLVVRPGFVQFDNAYLTSPVDGSSVIPERGTITHFAWNAAVSGDYRLGRNFALRGTIGETLVRYRTAMVDPPGIGTAPYLSWLSHENFVNRGNWIFEAGPVFRFGKVHAN